MDMLSPHRLQAATPLDILPGLRIGPMHDEVGTVGVGREDWFEDVLVGDCGDGMALGGADAPIFRGLGGGEAAVGAGGVGFELVALFVVGGDDGLEGGEINV